MSKVRVCPWWMGYLLANPLRRLVHNPASILGEHVRTGMKVLEIGPGMGFFSLPMAEMAGPSGKIIAVDIQPRMIKRLEERARRAGMAERIECRLCSAGSLGVDDLAGSVDFVFAFAVVHEMPGLENLFRQLFKALKKGGSVLMADPLSGFSKENFLKTISLAEAAGFHKTSEPRIRLSRSAILMK